VVNRALGGGESPGDIVVSGLGGGAGGWDENKKGRYCAQWTVCLGQEEHGRARGRIEEGRFIRGVAGDGDEGGENDDIGTDG